MQVIQTVRALTTRPLPAWDLCWWYPCTHVGPAQPSDSEGSTCHGQPYLTYTCDILPTIMDASLQSKASVGIPPPQLEHRIRISRYAKKTSSDSAPKRPPRFDDSTAVTEIPPHCPCLSPPACPPWLLPAFCWGS